MKKKIVTLALVAALVAVVAVGATLAYFTDTADAENVFTVGKVKIELTEPAWTTGGGATEADTVYPGEPLGKDPTVKNIGANPCFVRIKVDGLEQFVPTGATEEADKAPWRIIYRTNWVDNALGAGWVLHTDGWFYYKPTNNVLPAGFATTPLFHQIVIPEALKNGSGLSLTAAADTADLKEIVVTAQAVQAQGAKSSFENVKTMTLQEIADWFTTCGMPTIITP